MSAALLGASCVVTGLWVLFLARLPGALARVPRLDARRRPPTTARVSVIVPARDEEQLLPRCLAALAGQHVRPLEILVVDDGSTDRTRAVARRAAGVRVLAAPPRPPGWAGKPWAAWQGARAARGDWLLFLDADVRLEPPALGAALAEAGASGADLLAVLPRARCATMAEAIAQPVMALLLLWRLAPARVNAPSDPVAAAPGSFLLFRRAAYRRLGGHGAVRGEVVEDLRLAQAVKGRGLALRLVAGPHLVATWRAQSLAGLWHGWSRVAVEGLGRRAWLGLGAALAVLLLFVAPLAVAPLGPGLAALAALHLGVACAVRARLSRGLGVDARLALLQAVGALFAAAILLRAALGAAGAAGRVRWRGREYAP